MKRGYHPRLFIAAGIVVLAFLSSFLPSFDSLLAPYAVSGTGELRDIEGFRAATPVSRGNLHMVFLGSGVGGGGGGGMYYPTDTVGGISPVKQKIKRLPSVQGMATITQGGKLNVLYATDVFSGTGNSGSNKQFYVTTIDAGKNPSIDVDSNNIPHISYVDPLGRLKYAKHLGGSSGGNCGQGYWQCEYVWISFYTSLDPVVDSSISVGFDNSVHVSFETKADSFWNTNPPGFPPGFKSNVIKYVTFVGDGNGNTGTNNRWLYLGGAGSVDWGYHPYMSATGSYFGSERIEMWYVFDNALLQNPQWWQPFDIHYAAASNVPGIGFCPGPSGDFFCWQEGENAFQTSDPSGRGWPISYDQKAGKMSFWNNAPSDGVTAHLLVFYQIGGYYIAQESLVATPASKPFIELPVYFYLGLNYWYDIDHPKMVYLAPGMSSFPALFFTEPVGTGTPCYSFTSNYGNFPTIINWYCTEISVVNPSFQGIPSLTLDKQQMVHAIYETSKGISITHQVPSGTGNCGVGNFQCESVYDGGFLGHDRSIVHGDSHAVVFLTKEPPPYPKPKLPDKPEKLKAPYPQPLSVVPPAKNMPT